MSVARVSNMFSTEYQLVTNRETFGNTRIENVDDFFMFWDVQFQLRSRSPAAIASNWKIFKYSSLRHGWKVALFISQ